MLAWVIFFVCVAALLAVGIDRLMRRFGITPADPESARGGIEVLAERLKDWADQRRRR
ncbi:MAG TPA: hypothetical protein PKA95_00055 [Thermomicrobiales bacterium]|mgnify:CR=1 FL=1|nr:hypothetical protein [Thermomicrobiales bacterium]